MKCENITFTDQTPNFTTNLNVNSVKNTLTPESELMGQSQTFAKIVEQNSVKKKKRVIKEIPIYQELDNITYSQMKIIVDVLHDHIKLISSLQDTQTKLRERIIDLENDLMKLRIKQEQDFIKHEQDRVAFWKTLMFWRKW